MLLRERQALAEAAEKTKGAKRAQRVAARAEQSRRAVGAAGMTLPAADSALPASTAESESIAAAEVVEEDDVFASLGDLEEWGTPVLNWGRTS